MTHSIPKRWKIDTHKSLALCSGVENDQWFPRMQHQSITKPLHTNFSTSSIHQLISRHQRSSQGGAQHNSGDLPEYEENNNEGRFDPEGADVDSRSKSGFVNGMALTVPSLALSLKLNKVEENKGTMADNVEDTKMVEMRIL